jgi:hypothetical protein
MMMELLAGKIMHHLIGFFFLPLLLKFLKLCLKLVAEFLDALVLASLAVGIPRDIARRVAAELWRLQPTI